MANTQRVPFLVAAACALGVAAVLGFWPARLGYDGWTDLFADDAFFYFVIAKNLATLGRSTFDGLTLTNGYQPLWQGMLALQYALADGSLAPTVFVELAAVALASFLAFRTAEPDSFWCLPLFAALIGGLIGYPLVLDGMETSVLFLAFSAFILALRAETRSLTAWWPMAIAGAAVTAARLDAAFFVIAALLVVPARKSHALRAFVFIGFCGALYCLVNKLIFDAWLPVSGTVKSLGAFARLNHALVDQFGTFWEGRVSMVKAAIGVARSLPGRCLCLAVLTAVLLVAFPRRESFAWKVALAMVLGFVVFAARLAFFMSWRVWEWYAFPIFFLLVADFLLLAMIFRAPAAGWLQRLLVGIVVALIIETSTVFTAREALAGGLGTVLVLWLLTAGGRAPRLGRAAMALLGVGLTVMAFVVTTKSRPQGNPVIAFFSRVLAGEVRDRIGVARVAMADRAAAFAYYYGGPLTQLEGLVNDEEYLDALEKRRPLLPLLCKRDVRYLISFEVDLGDYTTHDVHPFRSYLTMFDGPTIAVGKADEVVKIADAPSHGVRDFDAMVYVWRLPCLTAAR